MAFVNKFEINPKTKNMQFFKKNTITNVFFKKKTYLMI